MKLMNFEAYMKTISLTRVTSSPIFFGGYFKYDLGYGIKMRAKATTDLHVNFLIL